MVKFRLPRFNSDFKAHFSHFKKGIFTILGLLVIAGLIVGSFIYGNNERTQEANQGETSTEQSAATEQAPTSDQTDSNPDQAVDSPEPAGDGEPAPNPKRNNQTRLPSNGPAEVANTGPEDWLAPITAAALFLLYRKYRHSQKDLHKIQLG